MLKSELSDGIVLVHFFEAEMNNGDLYGQCLIRIWLEPSVRSLHSFCRYFCKFSESLQIPTEQSKTTGDCGGSVAVTIRSVVLAGHEAETLEMAKYVSC